MANNTVIDLAREMKIPAQTLLAQLKAAGIEKTGETDELSEADKRRLLDSLRSERVPDRPSKITVKRRETSTIRQKDGQGGAHTIEVEVRRRRVFVKSPRQDDERARAIAAARAETEAAARRALEEKQAQAAQAENDAAKAAEAVKAAEAEKAAKAAQEARAQQAQKAAAEKAAREAAEQAAAEKAARRKAREEAVAKAPVKRRSGKRPSAKSSIRN